MSLSTVTLTSTGQQVKLGRNRPTAIVGTNKYVLREYADGSHKLTLKFASYYDPAKDANAPPPVIVDWMAKAAASLSHMYLNDQLGDCVIAGKYHAVGIWTGNETGTAVTGTDAEVKAAYTSICGPGDNGCNIVAVLDAFKTSGLKFNGVTHKISDYVSIDWTNQLLVQVALEVFGTITLGINLPQAWLDAPEGGTWDVTTSQIVGGHDVTAGGYDATGVWVSTWGGKRKITWKAFLSKQWIEEAEVPLSPDWYSNGNLAPNGIDGKTLAIDLAALGNGVVPPIGPPSPTPPVPPTPVPPTPPVSSVTITLSQPVRAGQYVRFTKAKPAGVYALEAQTMTDVVEAE